MKNFDRIEQHAIELRADEACRPAATFLPPHDAALLRRRPTRVVAGSSATQCDLWIVSS